MTYDRVFLTDDFALSVLAACTSGENFRINCGFNPERLSSAKHKEGNTVRTRIIAAEKRYFFTPLIFLPAG